MATTRTELTMQAPQVVVSQPPQPQPANFKTIRGLAITQLVIGIVSCILGIVSKVLLHNSFFTAYIGTGIWAGCWIGFTGLIGVCSTHNRNMNGVYMGFSIISTCTSGIAGIFCIIGVSSSTYMCEVDMFTDEVDSDCSYRDLGLGLHIPLLLLITMEFLVSIIAAIFCCYKGHGTVIEQYYMPAPNIITASGVHPTNVQFGGQIGPQYGDEMLMQPQYTTPYVDQANHTQPLSAESNDSVQEKASFSYQKLQ